MATTSTGGRGKGQEAGREDRPGDLPLARDPSARFLPWIIALMAFLAVLATSGALATHDFARRWNVDLGGVLTIQVPSQGMSEAGPGAEAVAGSVDGRATRVLEIVRRTANVVSARILAPSETVALLAPWVGEEVVRTLPLPSLIDVRLLPGTPIDIGALEDRLQHVVPDVVVDDHGRWLSHVAALSRSLQAAGIAIVALVLLSAALVVSFTVRTGLATHAEVIEILHLIGARDSYIAGRFQRHVLTRSLVGAIIGAVLALVTVLALALGTESRDPIALGAEAPSVALAILPFALIDWLMIAIVPCCVVLVAVVTARLAVLANLARLP